MNSTTGRERRHLADARTSANTRSWDDLEEWSREGSGVRRGPRWSALKDPRVILGILTAGVLVLGGAHMATSMTPHDDTVAVTAPTPQGTPEATTALDEGAAPDGTSPASVPPAPGASNPPASGKQTVVVHVVGAVKQPKLVELPSEVRVGDALEAAGGPTEDADLGRINLARVVNDGEQVYVPRQGEETPAAIASPATGVEPSPSGPGAEAGGDGALVNINTASESELDELPGVGPAIAARIVEHRTTNGPFSNIEQLQDVKGIGPAIFEKLRERISI
ncbi:helix-hairpin-helix domain-containing protein [Dermabacter hominis]|uniref:helix-hairpin-helix domain-containing protein n=1 Tax=Dermabacter hominis TaxID=36740 RepID=UPI00223B5C7C|nr:helix-hairpin-helix domain-containing protein [Dermabacter hominis]MCT2025649.1 helix-hairpin-helix domain-containing protein [Dermabacter hominis]